MRQLLISVLILLPTSSITAQQVWKKHEIVPPRKTSINTAVAHDFDGDGNMDVISSYENGVVVLKGPNWEPHIVYTFPPKVSSNRGPRGGCIHSCLMDVDDDGDLDFCGSSNAVFWVECPKQPFSGKPWKYHNIDIEILGTHCLITGDVNKDGKLDLIANSGRPTNTDIPNSLTWLQVPKNPRKAKAWIRHVFAEGDAPGGSHYTGFGDINADGKPDICCGAKGGEKFPGGEWFAWWEQPADGSTPWKKHLLSDKQPGATNIHPVDLNNDKQIDFFATRGHSKGVLWFRAPEFKPVEIDSEIETPHCLSTVDFDDDGDIDAVTCGSLTTGKCVWYENDGKANFKRHLIGENQGSYDIRTVDMDGDKDLDVLIAGHGSKNIVWYENPRL